MGLEVKRVPVDFDWPLGKTWEGYLMPDRLSEQQCGTCAGDGYSTEARAVANTFYPHTIPGYDRARQEALAWHDKIGQAEVDNLIAEGRLRLWRDGKWTSEPRTAEEVNAEQRSSTGFIGHDDINRMILIRFRCERLGIPMACASCDGHGSVEVYPGQRDEAEAWERREPPEGEGWQVWETVSEGSPITPVFDTAEGLARHLSTEGAWGHVYDYDVALRFVNAGWAPSMAASAATGVVDGIAAVGQQATP